MSFFHHFPLLKGHSSRLKLTVFDIIMLLKRLEEELSILVKEMSQHIKSLQNEIKGVEKHKKNIRMGSMSNSEHYFLTKYVFSLQQTSKNKTISNIFLLYVALHTMILEFNICNCNVWEKTNPPAM